MSEGKNPLPVGGVEVVETGREDGEVTVGESRGEEVSATGEIVRTRYPITRPTKIHTMRLRVGDDIYEMLDFLIEYHRDRSGGRWRPNRSELIRWLIEDCYIAAKRDAPE